MKKFFMTYLTIASVIITLAICFFTVSDQKESGYKLPKLSLSTEKYGLVSNMIWMQDGSNRIVFIGNKKGTSDILLQGLYIADIDSRSVEKLYEYEGQEFLQDFLYSFENGSNSVAVASAFGINIINFNNQKNKNENSNKTTFIVNNINIPEFRYAQKASIDGMNQNIYYTLDSKIMKVHKFNNMSNVGFTITYDNELKDKAYFFPLSGFVNNEGGDGIYILRKYAEKMNFYEVEIGNGRAGIKRNLIVKGSVNAKLSNDGIAAIYEKEDSYGIYTKNLISNIKAQDIPKHKDALDQVPDIEISNGNIVYTSFNEDKKGSIMHSEYGEVIKNLPIIGPVKVSNATKEVQKILFFTYENNDIKVKVSNIKGENVTDITSIFNQ
jgi:hypothetical protein